ncbi:MAG: serine hydrolase [Erythrobacter sp.]|nr:MAG: serine hydrolase [Erythrobacter sp.]
MKRLLLASLALTLMPMSVVAQESPAAEAPVPMIEQRAEDIVSVLRDEMAYEAVFSDGFRTAVPQAQMAAITAQLVGQFGAIIGVESVTTVTPTTAQIRIRMERGIASGSIELEPTPPNRVSGFLLTGVEPVDDSAQSVIDEMETLPGETSLLITRLDGSPPVAAHNAESPLALGSTFKLYVLSALVQAIAAGEHSWDEVVPLTERSYPSGMMQEWPQGAPVTVHTLATLMISISDNTATDQLIALLGRDAIEAEVAASGHSAPELMRPFMTTRELFVLKSGPATEIAAFAAADPAERLAALEALGVVERDETALTAAFAGGPNNIDIEWFASARDIAVLFDRLRADETALGILGVSPSMSDAARDSWAYAGYKGGSEPGVLNLSWLLQGDDGVWRVVTLGWNNPAASIDQQRFEFLAMRAVALAR